MPVRKTDNSICEVKPCSFNGVYQPSLIDTFKQGDFFALSYFTDRILPLLPPSTDVGKLTLDDLKTMAEDVCAGADMWKRRWGDNQKVMDELEDRPEYCLDLTFMHGLLGLGYEIHEDRNLLVEKKINGVELGWALGAGLALVSNADLKCLA
jgi:guanosine-diphosphatase